MNRIIAQWDDAAEKFMKDQEQSEYAESNRRTVRKRFADCSGKKVLDLGCGYGFYTSYFAGIGADVVGIDGSQAMIGLAGENHPECAFLTSDITKPLPFPDGSFDIVFCNQVLMDIENIDSVFSECRRVLKKNGIFYYSIVHPAFYDCSWLQDENEFRYAKVMERYIEPYSFLNSFWGETAHFHRPLSHYLNAAARNGLVLVETEEPVSYDGISKNRDLPLFFFAEYKKA